MNKPDFEMMSEQELRQSQASVNEFLGQQLAAQERRKQIMRARMEAENEVEEWYAQLQ